MQRHAVKNIYRFEEATHGTHYVSISLCTRATAYPPNFIVWVHSYVMLELLMK